MTSLLNIAAVLVFAALVAGAVAVGLRLLLPAEPHRPDEAEPRPQTARSRLASAAGLIAVVAAMLLAVEIRSAYGAPFGERDAPTVEVVAVGDCDRRLFGIARSCALTEYRYAQSDQEPGPWRESIEVVSGAPVEPGDLVARYSSDGWTAFVFLGSSGSRWQPIAAEDRPQLVWLPTAVLFAGALIPWRRRPAGTA